MCNKRQCAIAVVAFLSIAPLVPLQSAAAQRPTRNTTMWMDFSFGLRLYGGESGTLDMNADRGRLAVSASLAGIGYTKPVVIDATELSLHVGRSMWWKAIRTRVTAGPAIVRESYRDSRRTAGGVAGALSIDLVTGKIFSLGYLLHAGINSRNSYAISAMSFGFGLQR